MHCYISSCNTRIWPYWVSVDFSRLYLLSCGCVSDHTYMGVRAVTIDKEYRRLYGMVHWMLIGRSHSTSYLVSLPQSIIFFNCKHCANQLVNSLKVPQRSAEDSPEIHGTFARGSLIVCCSVRCKWIVNTASTHGEYLLDVHLIFAECSQEEFAREQFCQ